jgi:hypothetical protein
MTADSSRATTLPPNGPGYVADHLIPLRRGGTDAVENIRWQTIDEATAKDREE